MPVPDSEKVVPKMHGGAVYGVVSFAAIGAILFGIDQANFGGAVVKDGFIEAFCGSGENCQHATMQPQWYTNFLSLASALVQLGAACGAMVFGPPLARQLGRREAIFLGTIAAVIGCLLLATTQIVWFFLLSRFIVGLGVGIVTFALPMYTSEVTPPEIRGVLGCLFQFMAFVGCVLASLLNAFPWLGYRASLFLPGWPGIVLAIGILLLPVSPRFALLKGRRNGDDARGERQASQSLQTLRSSREAADAELAELRRAMANEQLSVPWASLWKDTSIRRRILVSCMLQWLQQFTGINAIIGYGPALFNSAGVPISGLWCGLMSMTCLLLGTGLMMFVIDRWGRRALLLLSSAGMLLFMTPAALLALVLETHSNVTAGWALLFCVCGYCIFFAIGFGPIPWLYPSEIFSMDVKERAMSFSVFSQWFSNFVIACLVPQQVLWLKPGGTFVFYAVCIAVCFALVHQFVPETKGLALESMDAVFGNRMTSKAAEQEVDVPRQGEDAGASMDIAGEEA